MTTETAERTEYTLDKVEAEQARIRGMKSRHAQVEWLQGLYPQKSWRWLDKRIALFLSFDAWQLVAAIGYPDPTGERATRSADRARDAKGANR